MDIRMIVSDLDGTLLNRSREMPDANRTALHACMARGIHVVLASGRSFESVRRLANEHGIDGPIVSANGARVDLSQAGPTLYSRTFPRELAASVFDIMKASGIFFTCYGHGTLYQNNLDAARARTRGMQRLEDKLVMQAHRAELVVSDESRTVNEGLIDPYKFVAFSEDGPLLDGLRERLKQSGLPLNISSSWVDNIEVMVAGAGKGEAVSALCGQYGLAREQVMAFGDNLNDVAMLRAAGWGVAMENALPEVKQAARLIAPLCDAAGVARVIDEYVLRYVTKPE